MMDPVDIAERKHDLEQEWEELDHQDPEEWQAAQEWAMLSREDD